jgi:hypothetical protein
VSPSRDFLVELEGDHGGMLTIGYFPELKEDGDGDGESSASSKGEDLGRDYILPMPATVSPVWWSSAI